MKGTRRQRRRCRQKQAFTTLTAAYAAAKAVERKNGGLFLMHGYRCPLKAHYHVGHARLSAIRRALGERRIA